MLYNNIAQLNILRILHELAGLIIALAFGMYALKYMNLIYSIFFFQLLTYLLIIILSYIAELIPNMNHNNQWVYNLAMPVEAGFLCMAGYEYFRTDRKKWLVWGGYFIFLGVFLFEIIIKGPLVFSNHGYVAEGILLVVLYLSVMYVQLTTQNNTWRTSPEVWISLGIVIYFSGVVPYFSLFNYLQLYYPKINLYLFRFVNIELSNVRYVLLAVGFWLIRRNAISKTTPAA